MNSISNKSCEISEASINPVLESKSIITALPEIFNTELPIKTVDRAHFGENPRQAYFSQSFPNCIKFSCVERPPGIEYSPWHESQSKIVCKRVLTVLSS